MKLMESWRLWIGILLALAAVAGSTAVVVEVGTFGAQLGLLAGAVFAGGLLLLLVTPPRWQWWAAGILLVCATPLALGGFWFSDDTLGISDWDYYFSYHHALRESVVTHHVFPLWNPYTCGGTAALGDPEFPLFTPTFLVELIAGIPAGFRLAIFGSVATTAVGMLVLARRLGLTVLPATLAATIFAFGSVNILELVEGHPNIFSVMWIPWVFWAWLRAYQRTNTTWFDVPSLVCGALLAMTFFQGGIYLLFYTGLAFLVLIAVLPRPHHALYVTLSSATWALGFAAIKLVPVMLWLSQFQDQMYAGSKYTLPWLHKIFLGRYGHTVAEIIPDQGSGWHEYGAYVGPGALLLAGIAIVLAYRQRSVRWLVLFGTLAIILSSSGPLLEPMFDRISVIPRSNISRVIVFAVIAIAGLAGMGLQQLTQKISNSRLRLGLAILFTACIAIDLMTFSYQLSQQAFVLPDVAKQPPPRLHAIEHTTNQNIYRLDGVDYTRAYPVVRAGYGSLSYCAVLGPDPAVRTVHEENNFGPVLEGNHHVLEFVEWSPNRITAHVTADSAAEVVLNTNYAKGWRVLIDGTPRLIGQPAREISNRVAAIVPPGRHTITYFYWPRGLLGGAIISLATVAAAAWRLRRWTFRRTHQKTTDLLR